MANCKYVKVRGLAEKWNINYLHSGLNDRSDGIALSLFTLNLVIFSEEGINLFLLC